MSARALAALLVLHGCSGGTVVPVLTREPGAVLVALYDGEGSVPTVSVLPASNPTKIEIDATTARAAITLLPASAFIHPDGSAVSLDELVGSHGRSADGAATAGLGDCGRCLMPQGSGPMIPFSGSSCPPPALPSLFAFDGSDAEPIADPVERARIQASLRLEWPGDCAAPIEDDTSDAVASVCSVHPDEEHFSSLALASSGLIVGMAYDRAIAIGPGLDVIDDVRLNIADARAQIVFLSEDATSARFALAQTTLDAEGDGATEIRLLDWDAMRATKRLRRVDVGAIARDLLLTQAKERGTDSFVLLGSARARPAAVDCVAESSSVRCTELTIELGTCAPNDALVAWAQSASVTAALGQSGAIYTLERGVLRCTGTLPAPPEPMIEVIGDQIITCAGSEINRTTSSGRSLIADAGARCLAFVRRADRVRVLTEGDGVIDVLATSVETTTQDDLYPERDRPIVGELARGGSDAWITGDTAIWRRIGGAPRTLVWGPPAPLVGVFDAIGVGRDGLRLVENRGQLLVVRGISGCPSAQETGLDVTGSATAFATDFTKPAGFAVASATRGTRRIDLIDLEGFESSQPLVESAPGSRLRTLVQLTPQIYVAIDEDERLLAVTREGISELPVIFDDPLTAEVEPEVASPRWLVASGVPGVVWVGGTNLLARVVPVPGGAHAEAYFTQRVAPADAHVVAIAALGPDRLRMALAGLGQRFTLYALDGLEFGRMRFDFLAPGDEVVGLAGANATLIVTTNLIAGRDSVMRASGFIRGSPPTHDTLFSTSAGRLLEISTAPVR